jgi:HEAT repeat protein
MILVALVEKRNSREYLEEIYRNDLMEKRMGPAMDRLRSRPQDIPLVTGLIKAEEFGVKLGAMALIEQLSEEAPEDQARIFDALIPLLQEKSVPTLGDAAYLLGFLQDPRKRSILKKLLDHSHPDIREIAQEGLNRSQGPEAGEA